MKEILYKIYKLIKIYEDTKVFKEKVNYDLDRCK